MKSNTTPFGITEKQAASLALGLPKGWHPPQALPALNVDTVHYRIELALPRFEWLLLIGCAQAAARELRVTNAIREAAEPYHVASMARSSQARDNETAARVLERVASYLARELLL